MYTKRNGKPTAGGPDCWMEAVKNEDQDGAAVVVVVVVVVA